MRRLIRRALGLATAAGFVSSACFSAHQISTHELGKLQSGFEAESVWVALDGCADRQDLGSQAPIEGRDPDTGCEVVGVSPTNTVNVYTQDGARHRITPFNFTLGETQLVSPDYDLLLPRDSLQGADVEVFSTGRTVAVIAGLTAAAVGTFLAISLTAGESRGLGGQ